MSDDVKRRSQRFLVILFLVALGLLAIVVRPFVGAFFAAAVLAGVMQRPQRALTARLGDRPNLSAGLMTAMVVLVVVIPIGVMGLMVVKEGTRVVRWTIETARDEGIDGLVKPLPAPMRRPARNGLELFADEWIESQRTESVSSSLAKPGAISAGLGSVGKAAGIAQSVLAGLGAFMMQLAILVLATFFMLAQGKLLVDYLVALAPLEEDKSRALLASLRQVSVAVFSSTIITAALQTVVAALGYVIAGLPSLALLLAATFLCSFIPAVGAAGVAIVAGIFLLLGGDTGYGIFLVGWGLLVVGMVDNIVKPWLTRGATELPGSLVFFAMICGLAVLGPMGMVAGPLIVAFFQVVARMLREEMGKEPAQSA